MHHSDERVWQNRNKNHSFKPSLPLHISSNNFLRPIHSNVNNQNQTYNTVIDDKNGPTYEDPDTLYDKRGTRKISDVSVYTILLSFAII